MSQLDDALAGFNQSNFDVASAASLARSLGAQYGLTDAELAAAVPVFGNEHRARFSSGYTESSNYTAIAQRDVADALTARGLGSTAATFTAATNGAVAQGAAEANSRWQATQQSGGGGFGSFLAIAAAAAAAWATGGASLGFDAAAATAATATEGLSFAEFAANAGAATEFSATAPGLLSSLAAPTGEGLAYDEFLYNALPSNPAYLNALPATSVPWSLPSAKDAASLISSGASLLKAGIGVSAAGAAAQHPLGAFSAPMVLGGPSGVLPGAAAADAAQVIGATAGGSSTVVAFAIAGVALAAIYVFIKRK